MAGSDLAAPQDAIGQLRQCVAGLRATYGDSPDVRRLLNDVDRLDIDAADLAGRPTPPKPRDPSGGKPEVVVVPDTPYDPALWLGADDEGVGGVRRHR
ncbi:MAG TPA: hypothetical protein VHV74_22510 [Pseudonocardiaceae bacterium]|jgi:hypothetical protein|nr:hypothetical protein [Pseudonocardiaceae bacterium]